MSYPVVTDPVVLAQRHHPAAGVLLPAAVEFAFHVMGSRRIFFDEMRLHIRPEHFTIEESSFAAIWVAMCQIADQIAGEFKFETLALVLQTYLVNQQSPIAPEVWATIFAPDESGILWTMTSGQHSVEHVTYARQILKQFLTERTVVAPLRQLLSRNGDYPGNIGELLETINDHSSRITGLQELPRVSVAPIRGATVYEPALIYRQTGVDYVDTPLGGQVVGDCNGLIGVTGGGKTTAAVHMAVEGARACWCEALREHSRTPDFVAYVSIEEEGMKLRPRIWSAAFSIPLDKLRKMRDWSELTTQSNIEGYERQLAIDKDDPEAIITSESDRYDAEQPMLAGCFELLDFSGSGEYKNSGRGYVHEIVSALDRVRETRGQPLRTVFLDYAGLLVERSVRGALDDRKLRVGLKQLGDEFHQVAARFGCTVWLLHQVRGAAGTQSPLKLVSHHDASETKDFANQLAVCGCLGTSDPITGCRRLNWSKTRNIRVEGVAPLTLRIHDRFARMENVTGSYTIDEPSRSFVSILQGRQISGPLEPSAAPPGLEPGNRNLNRPQAGAAANTQAVLNTAAPITHLG